MRSTLHSGTRGRTVVRTHLRRSLVLLRIYLQALLIEKVSQQLGIDAGQVFDGGRDGVGGGDVVVVGRVGGRVAVVVVVRVAQGHAEGGEGDDGDEADEGREADEEQDENLIPSSRSAHHLQ